jgi:hypothetical protein
MRQTISLIAPGTHSAYRRRCIARGGFIPVANNPVNRSIWRLAWKVPRPAAGFFIVLFPLPGGGTTLFSPEATCFSSGRKNGFANGAPRTAIPCGHWSRWTSYGRSRRPGIRRAYKRTRGVRSPTRCVRSSRASAWQASFGILNRILSVNRSLSTLNPQLSTPVQTLCAALLQKECDDRENRVEHERRDREGAIGRGRTA